MPQIEMRKILNIIMVKDKIIIVQNIKNTKNKAWIFNKRKFNFKKVNIRLFYFVSL